MRDMKDGNVQRGQGPFIMYKFEIPLERSESTWKAKGVGGILHWRHRHIDHLVDTTTFLGGWALVSYLAVFVQIPECRETNSRSARIVHYAVKTCIRFLRPSCTLVPRTP